MALTSVLIQLDYGRVWIQCIWISCLPACQLARACLHCKIGWRTGKKDARGDGARATFSFQRFGLGKEQINSLLRVANSQTTQKWVSKCENVGKNTWKRRKSWMAGDAARGERGRKSRTCASRRVTDCQSRSESEAAERANATHFRAPSWRQQIYCECSQWAPVGRSQMLSTLFYSPLRKLLLLIECCPWLTTRSQREIYASIPWCHQANTRRRRWDLSWAVAAVCQSPPVSQTIDVWHDAICCSAWEDTTALHFLFTTGWVRLRQVIPSCRCLGIQPHHGSPGCDL